MTMKRSTRLKRHLRQFLAVSALALLGQAHGAANPPDAEVRAATEEVLAVIASAPDARTLRQLAEEKVVPRFDFRRMTQLAAGRVWNQASPAQQDELTREFQHLLVRTYTKALAATRHAQAKVTVMPARIREGSNEATVKTTVAEPGRQAIAIDYRMEQADGAWKVVDVTVDSISLVTNYRDWFASQAQSGGVDGVIRALAEKNRGSAQVAG